MIDEPFDPWRAVAERDDVVVSMHPIARLMGGGFYARAGELGVIVVDPDLPGDQRRAVLTHELIHHERGGAPGGTGGEASSFVDDDERCVEREVALRLVPLDVLDRFIRASRARRRRRRSHRGGRSLRGASRGGRPRPRRAPTPAGPSPAALMGLRSSGSARMAGGQTDPEQGSTS